MKNVLIAALAVGATVAGLILYYETKLERRSRISGKESERLPALAEELAPPLPIQNIP